MRTGCANLVEQAKKCEFCWYNTLNPNNSLPRLGKEEAMPKATHYSPQIRRDLVTRLYHRAKAEKTPMTKLTNRLLDEALLNVVQFIEEIESSRVAESPPQQPASNQA